MSNYYSAETTHLSPNSQELHYRWICGSILYFLHNVLISVDSHIGAYRMTDLSYCHISSCRNNVPDGLLLKSELLVTPIPTLIQFNIAFPYPYTRIPVFLFPNEKHRNWENNSTNNWKSR